MAAKILKGVGSVLASPLGGLLSPVGALIAGSKKSVATPTPPPAPIVMPLPDDAAAKAAKRRSIAAQRLRQGRASTILTDTSQTLGG